MTAARGSVHGSTSLPTLEREVGRMDEPRVSEQPEERPRFDAEPDEAELPAGFDALYDEHFAFVWRSLKRLGVPVAALDDAVQDVFIVALRRRAAMAKRRGHFLPPWASSLGWRLPCIIWG